ncbi:hypothetical protein PR048_009212 [Dryococelus australis]|uniref:Uncharacterized protein n=1 Tax=Dryococelus australis TaxID=614101 RepID=A0ABQ9HZ95_9NEOP|nr:hypothetical protein PR048_009212 [Dryococelus australis]
MRVKLSGFGQLAAGWVGMQCIIPSDRRRAAREVTSRRQICECEYQAVVSAAGRLDYWTRCVRVEQHRIVRAGETGDPRENPPTSNIVWHGSYLQKSRVTRPRLELSFALNQACTEKHIFFLILFVAATMVYLLEKTVLDSRLVHSLIFTHGNRALQYHCPVGFLWNLLFPCPSILVFLHFHFISPSPAVNTLSFTRTLADVAAACYVGVKEKTWVKGCRVRRSRWSLPKLLELVELCASWERRKSCPEQGEFADLCGWRDDELWLEALLSLHI